MSTLRQNASMRVIKTARKLFANTPASKLPLTKSIYRRVYLFGAGSSDEVMVAFCGIKLSAPTKDNTIVPGLVGGFYEKIELDIFERLASLSKTIIDVGANIGLYCCVAAAHAPEGSKIVAFEPITENLDCLRRNIDQNGQNSRVVVEDQAVGESTGELKIFLAAGSIGQHSPSPKNALGSQTAVSVPMVTLDAYAAENLNGPIDLLKVDVEGYDGYVLRGAARMIEYDKPTLFVELVPSNLKNCNFPLTDFLDIIFSSYDNVFIADELGAVLERRTKKDLLGRKGICKNANLIAVSSVKHAEHLSVVEAYQQEMRARRGRRLPAHAQP
jgi:FkbM family methyltransferase